MYFALVNRQTKHKNYNNNQIRPGNYDYVGNTETDNSYVFNIFEQTIPLQDIYLNPERNSVSYYILHLRTKLYTFQ